MNPSAIYWMDIFHIDLLQKLYCLFEKTENKRKRGRDFKKYYWIVHLDITDDITFSSSIPWKAFHFLLLTLTCMMLVVYRGHEDWCHLYVKDTRIVAGN